jgi:hypothetical protein
MIRRLVAVALVVTGSGLLFLGSPAVAADVAATGWWSRLATNDPLSESPQALPVPNPTTPDTVPVAATVGADQLLVEGTPDGATAVAAIRWVLADGESSPTLTLPIGPGSSVSPASVVLACRAGAAWTPPDPSPGRWESKPVVDAQACINGIVADDVSSIAFGLQPLVRRQVLDIVLVPGRFADVPELPIARTDGSSFRWVFDAPTLESLRTIEDSGFVEGSGSVFVEPPPAEPEAPAPAEPPPAAAFGGGTPSVAAPSAPAPALSAPAPVAPALDPQEIAAPGAVPPLPLPVESSSARTLGALLLLLGAACAAWAHLSPHPEAAAIGLGRFRRSLVPDGAPSGTASATEGGLGRFARPRDAPPVPIA